MVGEGEYLFDSIRDLRLVADVTGVKRSVIVALNDVKNGYGITAGKQGIYDVAAEKTAAADDEESVAVHDTMWREKLNPDRRTGSSLYQSRSRENSLITRNRSNQTLPMFSPEQKSQLLANLDIEGTVLFFCSIPSHPPSVAHRSRQLESWLSDTLAAFRNRHESQLAYIPHVVRGMTMAEFDEKYDGDVQAALRGLQKERIAVKVAPLDRNEMKRKWAPVPEEEEPEACLGDSGKNLDNHTRATKHRE